MADETPLICELPQLTEVVIDFGIGILVILLFSPFFYAVNLFIAGNLTDFNYLITIFPETWKLFGGIGLGFGLLLLFLTYILGISSRSILFLSLSVVRSIPLAKWIERKLFSPLVYRLLKAHYGTLEFKKEDIEENFIDKGFFWQVGNREYSCFRAELARTGSYLNQYKSYWDHEEFESFLFERMYSLFLTFFISYLFYGLVFILYFWHDPFLNVELSTIIVFLLFLVVTNIITISLYNEMVFHGMAFVRIDEVLCNLFKTDNKPKNWSDYKELLDKMNNKEEK